MASFTGTVEILDFMPEMAVAFAAAAHELVLEGAKMVNEEARARMEDGKSGVWYLNLPNQSSAPGEAPAVQSGELYDSLDEGYESPFAAIAGTDTLHSTFMEQGTIYIAPRPFYGPAAETVYPQWVEKIADRLLEITEGP